MRVLLTSRSVPLFSLPVNFIAIQLPGYMITAPTSTVFYMRMAQAAGIEGVENAAIVATYDDSCAANQTNGAQASLVLVP